MPQKPKHIPGNALVLSEEETQVILRMRAEKAKKQSVNYFANNLLTTASSFYDWAVKLDHELTLEAFVNEFGYKASPILNENILSVETAHQIVIALIAATKTFAKDYMNEMEIG